MSALAVRRLVVWVVSMALGTLVTWLVLTFFLPSVNPSPNASPVSIAQFGKQYFFWTAFPFGMVFVTIFDYFMDTRIWPD
jgi:flagellar biosynthesis protein FlhB